MNKPDLADKLARSIFAAGDDPKDPCTRIAFIGGTYGIDEHTMGGFIESALASCIRGALRKHLPSEEPWPLLRKYMEAESSSVGCRKAWDALERWWKKNGKTL